MAKMTDAMKDDTKALKAAADEILTVDPPDDVVSIEIIRMAIAAYQAVRERQGFREMPRDPDNTMRLAGRRDAEAWDAAGRQPYHGITTQWQAMYDNYDPTAKGGNAFAVDDHTDKHATNPDTTDGGSVSPEHVVTSPARQGEGADKPVPGSAPETPQTIVAWADATFGKVTVPRLVARANEELAECLRYVTLPDVPGDKVAEEAADVVIVLCRVFDLCASDMWTEVERKMAINRNRKWKLDGAGHGYHVRDKPEAAGESPDQARIEKLEAIATAAIWLRLDLENGDAHYGKLWTRLDELNR